jgi:hypothetical protein
MVTIWLRWSQRAAHISWPGLISVVQGTIVYGLLAAAGLFLANRIGLGAPIWRVG